MTAQIDRAAAAKRLSGAGLRLWDASRANVEAVLSAHPRGAGLKGELAALIRAEAPGRFRAAVSLPLTRLVLPLAARVAPFDV